MTEPENTYMQRSLVYCELNVLVRCLLNIAVN